MVLTLSAADLNLSQLALLTDRMVEVSPTPTIVAVKDPAENLTAQVKDLTK